MAPQASQKQLDSSRVSLGKKSKKSKKLAISLRNSKNSKKFKIYPPPPCLKSQPQQLLTSNLA